MTPRSLLERLVEPVDARVPAIFRIATGLVIAFDFADRLRDAFTFYSSQGLLAPDAEIAAAPSLNLLFFGAAPSPARVVCFFVFSFLVIACFTLGYRTRLAAVATWAVVYAVQMRNLTIGDGGDTVLRILLFWALFVDLGATLSLDVAWRRRPIQATVPGFPVRLLRAQIAFIYLFAGLAKTGQSWMNGSAVYYAVQSLDFGRPWGLWLAAHLSLARLVAFGTLAVELGFAPLVLLPVRWPLPRALGLVSGLALHAGIALTMRVGIFSVVLPASYTIFLSRRWLDAVPGVRRGSRPASQTSASEAAQTERPPRRWPRATAALWIVLGLQMATVIYQLIAGNRAGRWAAGIYGELSALGLSQGWTMFSPEPPKRLTRFAADGELTDGRSIDVLSAVAPKMIPDGGVIYSRWYKYRSDLASNNPQSLTVLGRYLCRRYNSETDGARLQRFTLTLHWRELPPPGSAARSDWEKADYLQQPCLPTPAR